MLDDPEQRQILEIMAPDLVAALDVNGKDLKAAKAGLPASSKPRASKAARETHGSDPQHGGSDAQAGLPASSKPRASKAAHEAHGSDPQHGGSDAKAGLPASSKPRASKAAGDPQHGGSDPNHAPDGSGGALDKSKSNEKALDAAAETECEDEVNSSTHRAAHARLSRRMERLDPAAFPQMSKLWSGTRKDLL